MIAHGYARTTDDVDVAVVALPDQVDVVLAAARAHGFAPRVADAASFAKQNLVLLLEHRATGVDLDVSFAVQDFERAAAELAVVRELGGVRLTVTPLDALLVYKMVAGRAKDVDDVRGLLATGAVVRQNFVDSTLREIDALLDTSRADDFRVLLDEHARRRRPSSPRAR